MSKTIILKMVISLTVKGCWQSLSRKKEKGTKTRKTDPLLLQLRRQSPSLKRWMPTPKGLHHAYHRGATEYNPQGGHTVRKNHLWMKKCHPVSRKAFYSFIDIHILETQHCNTVLYSIYLILDTGMFEPRETNLRAFLSVSHQHQS